MFIDAHAHMDRYEDTRQALREIVEHRIFTVSNSMDLNSYRRNQKIAQMSELVLPIFGVHPWHAPEYVDRLSELDRTIEQSPMLGEIGLDHHFVKDSSQYEAQLRVLDYFLRAAQQQRKIVNLHTKGAEHEILKLLDSYDLPVVIIHWYSGPLDIFRKLLSRGLYFTIGVEVLRSDHIQAIAREVPLEQLLTETDNPGASEWLTGLAKTPILLLDVVRAIAGLKNLASEAIAEVVHANVMRLIADDPRLEKTRHLLQRESSGV